MSRSSLYEMASRMALFVIVLAFSTMMAAQVVKIEGMIKSRNGDEMIVQVNELAEQSFLLTDETKVEQVGGLFKASRTQMSMAALIPGLKVKAEGSFNDQRQLLATSVKFSGDDLEQAQAIQAGTHEVREQAAQNQAELEKQNAELKAQNEALQQQQAQLTEQQAKIAANKAAIAANTARFGQLDDYYIWDELTVYFGNGQTKVDPKYTPQLLALADKAKTVNGYMIEVIGYASSAGSVSLNQKLSEDRASNVTNILMQEGHIPLTRMLAPGAMGESRQVSNDKTAEGQAENRRVVVRVLQNKAIAGV
jgi:outer membrane protein OmpA-like peptidoglycan-associated protein